LIPAVDFEAANGLPADLAVLLLSPAETARTTYTAKRASGENVAQRGQLR